MQIRYKCKKIKGAKGKHKVKTLKNVKTTKRYKCGKTKGGM